MPLTYHYPTHSALLGLIEKANNGIPTTADTDHSRWSLPESHPKATRSLSEIHLKPTGEEISIRT